MRVASVLLLVLPLLAACGSDADTAPRSVEFDSAGVRVVEHTPAMLREAPLELTERIRLGTLDDSSAELFSEVVDGLLLADGSFVVADRDSREVRQFSPEGELVRTRGGGRSAGG